MKDTVNAEAETSGPHTQPRIAYHQASPKAVRPLWDLEEYIRNCGLEPGLIELVKLRASEINGCAYCIDMHTKDGRARGETEQRLYAVGVWAETPFYSDRERAALAWTEAATQEHRNHRGRDCPRRPGTFTPRTTCSFPKPWPKRRSPWIPSRRSRLPCGTTGAAAAWRHHPASTFHLRPGPFLPGSRITSSSSASNPGPATRRWLF